MPRIYLDPSVDESNTYTGGGNEEYYMNLIVDAMIPYLNMAGIGFTRNNPSDTLNDIIAQSNAGNYDLHLSLRSTPANATQLGPIIYYDTYSPEAQSVAYYIARSLWSIYPDPNLIEIVPNSTLSQIALTTAPTVIVDLVNPNSYEDTEWLRNNIYRIARMIVFGLTDYFKIPFDIKREPLRSAAN